MIPIQRSPIRPMGANQGMARPYGIGFGGVSNPNTGVMPPHMLTGGNLLPMQQPMGYGMQTGGNAQPQMYPMQGGQWPHPMMGGDMPPMGGFNAGGVMPPHMRRPFLGNIGPRGFGQRFVP